SGDTIGRTGQRGSNIAHLRYQLWAEIERNRGQQEEQTGAHQCQRRKRTEPQGGLDRRGSDVENDCEKYGAEQQKDDVGECPHGGYQRAHGHDNEYAADEDEVGLVPESGTWAGHGQPPGITGMRASRPAAGAAAPRSIRLQPSTAASAGPQTR